MPKPHNIKISLLDMLMCIQQCLKFTDTMTFEQFDNDDKCVSAVLHQIMILGEASTRLPKTLKDRYPSVPWRDISDMRNILIHQYEDADLVTVWDTVTEDLPPLEKELRKILKTLDATEHK